MLAFARCFSFLILSVCLSAGLWPHETASAETSGAIVFNGQINDGAFNEQGYLGTSQAEAQLGVAIRQRVAANNMETKEALRTYARLGISHIMVLGFTNTEAVRSVALEFPDTHFTLVDGFIDDMKNVRSVQFAMEEAGYLGGYAAGLKTKTNKLGAIGGMNIPPVRQLICGFLDGARRANPSVEIEIEFISDSVEGFRNVLGAYRLAQTMISAGADVIFAAAGYAAIGAANAASDKGVYSVMTDANRNDLAPGSVLTTSMIRLDQAVLATWLEVWNNTWAPGIELFTLSEKGLDWAVDVHNEELIAPILDEVEAQKAALAANRIKIEPASELEGCADVINLSFD